MMLKGKVQHKPWLDKEWTNYEPTMNLENASIGF
jgi:hypothetical protein